MCDSKMSRKLYYFEVNGFGEAIRYILHYKGIEFEDIRYDRPSWPKGLEDIKDALPYGKMPVYEEGDRKLTQSLAIARYIASQTDLLPSDPWEQAVLDAAALNVYDLMPRLGPFIMEKNPTKKEQVKKELLAGTLDFYLSRFERDLKANNGFFGGKLTWADFVLVGILECVNLFLGTEVEKNYPTITTLLQHIRSLPGVKEYIDTRKPYVSYSL